MSNDLNNCQFIGRLGRDPEVKYMASGEAVANFILAVGSQWKNSGSAPKKFNKKCADQIGLISKNG